MAATDASGATVLPLPLDNVNEDIEAALEIALNDFLPSFDDDADILGGGAPLPAVYAPQAMTVEVGGGVVPPVDPLARSINKPAPASAHAGNGARRPSSSSRSTPPSSAAAAAAPAPAQRPARGPSLASQQGAAPSNG